MRNRKSFTMDFHVYRVEAFADGSSLAGFKHNPETMKAVPTTESGFLGAPFADEVKESYATKDEITRRFANVEHAVMHLFLGVLRSDPTFESTIEESFALANTMADYGALLDAIGIGENDFAEAFITSVQIAANRDLSETEDHKLKGAAIALGLNGEASKQAALSFLNVTRLRFMLAFGGK